MKPNEKLVLLGDPTGETSSWVIWLISPERKIRIKNVCILITYKPQSLSFVFLHNSIKMVSYTLTAWLLITYSVSSATPLSLRTVFINKIMHLKCK